MKTNNKITLVLAAFLMGISLAMAQSATIAVKSFNKIIISPHIEATLVEGEEEIVVIENSDVPREKINVEVVNNTLKIYLDDAKTYTKSKKARNSESSYRQDMYSGTMVTAKITYKTLEKLSVRGEETISCISPIEQQKFELTVYGESKVYFTEMNLHSLAVSIYGESYLEIDGGSVSEQKYKAYGESEVNTLKMENSLTKITAYGESEFRVTVSDKLKVTSYGEADIEFHGDADVDKGIVLGEASIRKIG